MITKKRIDDDVYVVKNGEVVRRGMLAWDSRTAVTPIGYGGDDDLAKHRPGERRALDHALQDARDAAYEKMVAEASRAWASPARRESEEDSERACQIARDEISIADAQKIRDAAYWRM